MERTRVCISFFSTSSPIPVNDDIQNTSFSLSSLKVQKKIWCCFFRLAIRNVLCCVGIHTVLALVLCQPSVEISDLAKSGETQKCFRNPGKTTSGTCQQQVSNPEYNSGRPVHYQLNLPDCQRCVYITISSIYLQQGDSDLSSTNCYNMAFKSVHKSKA